MRSSFCFWIAVVLVLTAVMSSAQTSAASSNPLPKVSILGSEIRSLKSTDTGRNYDLYIHLPPDYEKEKSKQYPVIYVLDGQWDFKLMDSVLGGLVYDKF